jgi:hypothetical protein
LLVGHLSLDEAIQIALGRCALPTDDVAALASAIETRRSAVRRRAAFHPIDPIKSDSLPSLDAVAARHDVQGAFNGLPWTPEWIDMRQVVSIQKEIITTGLDDRVRLAVSDDTALADLCFPPDNQAAQVSWAHDLDGKGVTLLSRSPNVRVNAIVPDPAKPMVAVYWGIAPGFINVARYQGRYYLRDGYHRVTGLLKAGRPIVPAVVFDVPSFQLIATGPALFSEAITTLDAPPLVRDFWDDSVALDASHLMTRTGLHVRATEVRLPELPD